MIESHYHRVVLGVKYVAAFGFPGLKKPSVLLVEEGHHAFPVILASGLTLGLHARSCKATLLDRGLAPFVRERTQPDVVAWAEKA